jgi:hypothetical protein
MVKDSDQDAALSRRIIVVLGWAAGLSNTPREPSSSR